MANSKRTLADLIEELSGLPQALLVNSVRIKMVTESGNHIDYEYPIKEVKAAGCYDCGSSGPDDPCDPGCESYA